MNGRQIFSIAFVLTAIASYGQKSISVVSPSGQIKVTVESKDSIYYSFAVNGKTVIASSAIALVTNHGKFGIRPVVLKYEKRTVNEVIVNPVPIKRKRVPDHFNEVTIRYRENFALIFRAYDDGVAYRFETALKDSLEIQNEIASFRFAQKAACYFPEVKKRENVDIYHTSFEEPYQILSLHQINKTQICFSPTLIDDQSIKTFITESDLIDYPGMFLGGTSSNGLHGVFAPAPDKEEVQGGEFKQWVVTARKNYIARTCGTRNFPWRVIGIAQHDGDLLINDLVYRLGKPPASSDWSWIKPGISTDEWICGINLHNVGFKAGINTETYKYYVDFASRFGMQYVMLDAGWSDYDDLFKTTPGLDLKELSAYAKTKNIGLMLWTLSMTLDRQLDEALDMFNSLGIKGFLTDFMDRDDQKMVGFYHRVAKAAAQSKLMVMFHGAFKNAGLERTYPNAITREAILGSEYNIWSDKATPEHDLLIPFIRMLAGPLDYEPGFYNNANQRTFKPLPDMVMSQGTRVHQLAMFVAYDSPMQIFSGNPSDAYLEVEFTTYLASLPTSWDNTKVIDAKIGDYLIMARQKDSDWYVTAMTDWTPREFQIDLSFLAPGKFRAFICEDGLNASKNASDYKMGYQLVDASSKLNISMSAGGGYVVKLIKLNDARP
ncbi:MAG: glycoside hydrolase family 97 protein [Chryseolinea sp.]